MTCNRNVPCIGRYDVISSFMTCSCYMLGRHLLTDDLTGSYRFQTREERIVVTWRSCDTRRPSNRYTYSTKTQKPEKSSALSWDAEWLTVCMACFLADGLPADIIKLGIHTRCQTYPQHLLLVAVAVIVVILVVVLVVAVAAVTCSCAIDSSNIRSSCCRYISNKWNSGSIGSSSSYSSSFSSGSRSNRLRPSVQSCTGNCRHRNKKVVHEATGRVTCSSPRLLFDLRPIAMRNANWT